MNLEQKNTVKQLRHKGLGYKAIADILEVSVNTVKSYCQRNHLGQNRHSESHRLCDGCGQLFIQVRGRKKKRFCCDECRQRWWNANQHLVEKKAHYHITCKHCKQCFTSYGNNQRKYCSHACYIQDRFGGDCYAS